MLKFELRKFFSKKTNKVILAALFLITVILSFLAVDSMGYTDMGEKFVTGLDKIAAGRRLAAEKNKWKGKLTPGKIADAVRSYHELEQQYPDILYFAADIYKADSGDGEVLPADLNRLAEENLAHIYDTYADNLQSMAKVYGKTPEQEKFLKKQYKKIQMPVTYEAYDSWENIAMYAKAYILIVVVVVGFLAAGIFDEEFRNHAELVFFTTKCGRSRAVRSKIVVGIITTTIIYWTGIGILSLISFGILGGSGFDTPYQIKDPYNFYIITQGQRYFMVVAGGYIASLLSATVTMLVTAKMHSEKIAIFIPVFMYWILLFFAVPLSDVTNLAYLMTNTLVDIDVHIQIPYLFQIGNVVFRHIPFVMILYAAVSIILLPFIYRSYSGYGIAKVDSK